MVYRFYVNASDAADKLSAVYGSDSSPSSSVRQRAFICGHVRRLSEGLTEFLLGFFPDTADDSYATVNLSGPASASGISGAAAHK